MEMLKCISLHQPWASLCVLPSLSDPDVAVKPYETRHWPTNYRGTLLIHAAKKWGVLQRDLCFQSPFRFAIEQGRAFRYEGHQQIRTMDLGCIVGMVELVKCYKMIPANVPMGEATGGDIIFPTGDALAFGDFSIGRYAWKLAKPRMFKTPIQFKGAQGFFNVPAALVAGQGQAVQE